MKVPCLQKLVGFKQRVKKEALNENLHDQIETEISKRKKKDGEDWVDYIRFYHLLDVGVV